MARSPSLPNLDKLEARGFQVVFRGHARAILGADFPQPLKELEGILLDLKIPIEEIIASGGGETKGTQRLRRALGSKGWAKTKFEITKAINKRPRESISHEVDHVKSVGEDSAIALEIEWNNKDPFFDRDLENFKRLHAEGAISVGVIVTRGETLQDQMPDLVRRFVRQHKIADLAGLERFGYAPTPKQRKVIAEKMARASNPLSFIEAFTDKFVSDKFGQATTHWRKLMDRISRGVGNPCPLLLIGLPASIVSFDETTAALKELSAQGDEDE
jgi:Restriction endonuclease BglII